MALLSLSLCLVSMIISLVTSPVTGSCKTSRVKLENNEYTGIVVAIHEDEPVNLELIDVIKEMFTSGSEYLYTATKKRAYFKEVTILIPLSWPDSPSYTSPGIANFEEADIIVADFNPRTSPDGPSFSNPYTKQFAGCGEESLYIHMTSSFLLNEDHWSFIVGDYGRVLVHEWGHYRWGLFNEFPDHITEPGQVKDVYHSAKNQKWKPVSCTSDWRYKALKFTGIQDVPYRRCPGDWTNGFEKDCIMMPKRKQPSGITGSIMHAHLNFDQVVNFCDNGLHDNVHGNLHNSEAPTKQNERCDGRSCWEVMREHPDFKGDTNNRPREVDDFTPTFFVVRSKVMRIVLVLDTSGSMRTSDRYLKLADAARTYIMTVAAPGTFIGIVDFDSDATAISPLTEMTSDTVRRTLANLVPVDASGGTCIGCGLDEALSILKANGDPGGSKILLMTDGEDGQPRHTTSSLDDVIENKVTIDVVAITNVDEPPNLERLATDTCGQFYLQTDDSTDDTFWTATQRISGGGSNFETIVQIGSSVVVFEKGDSHSEGHVYIDETVGRLTTFQFTYFHSTPTGRAAVLIVLESPVGRLVNRFSVFYDDDLEFKKVTIRIPGIAETGRWRYYIYNQDTTVVHDVIVSVASYPSQEGVDAIRVSSFLRGSLTGVFTNKPLVVYAEVRQRFNPVLHASVFATIEKPSGVSVELQLFDNGADPDLIKDDGIYSRYFSQVYSSGVFGFKIRVANYGPGMTAPPKLHSGTGIYFSPEFLLYGNITELLGDLSIALPGAPIPEIVGVPAPVFTREVSGGARTVSELPPGWDPSIDTFAPSKITDLVVLNTSFSLRTVAINFTAPGDDFDFGNAHHYIIRWARSSQELRNKSSTTNEIYQTDVLHGNLLSPAPCGVKQRMIVRVATIPQHLETYSVVLGLYAVDEAGNEGDMSNTVTVTFRRVRPTPEDRSCQYRYHPFRGVFLDCDN